MVDAAGIEPATSAMSMRRSKPTELRVLSNNMRVPRFELGTLSL